jgi:hypothetical protein
MTMKPSEFYDSQAAFNKNLQEMSEYDRAHIITMIGEYAIMCVEDCRNFVMGVLKDTREKLSQPIEPQTVNNFTDGL